MLLPHLRIVISQQNIGTYTEALDITMRLNEIPIQDMMLGVKNIRTELQNLYLEFHSLKKEKRLDQKCVKNFGTLSVRTKGMIRIIALFIKIN